MIDPLSNVLFDLAIGVAGGVISNAIDKKPPTARNPHLVLLSEASISKSQAVQLLSQHFLDTKHWASTVSFRELQGEKSLSNIFIELDATLTPRRMKLSRNEPYVRAQLRELVRSASGHLIISGDPGAGKTTSVKKLCAELLSNKQPILNVSFPLVLRLREPWISRQRRPILDSLRELLPLVKPHTASKLITQPILDQGYIAFLDELRPLIVLDGFDELPSVESKRALLEDFRDLCRKFKNAKMVLTSRSGDFIFDVQGAQEYVIEPLTKDQILEFSKKWLANQDAALAFTEAILSSPFSDAAIRPLSLAHLCAIYERSGSIPDQPKLVYQKVVRLLLRGWDEERSIPRATKFSQIESEKKFDFLCGLAFHLSTESRRFVFARNELVSTYKTICEKYTLPADEALAVIQEVEAHTGLIIESSLNEFEFAHASVQEYLVAEFIRSLPYRKLAKRIHALPNELAIAVSLSMEPTEFFSEIMLNWIANAPSYSPDFLNAFAKRLITERPRLTPSFEGALGYLLLASLSTTSEETDHSLGLLLCGTLGKSALDTYYEVKNVADDRVSISRRRPHPDYLLPTALKVPRKAFALFS